MASLNVYDLEAQTNNVRQPQPSIDEDPPPRDTQPPTSAEVPQPPASGIPQPPTSGVPQPQVTNPNERHNGNAVPTADNTSVQRDENHGDSSDGLWSMYLTEAEKQDKEVTESWKGDTDGILVFTGLFSATVASFIIESYQKLSPDSGDTTNALLTQISGQLFNISNGIPLTSVGTQSSQPFKPTASAVRVNVLWFLSLVLSLNCALSATLMQQWARRYQELAQRRSATHRRGRMRAYIFDGITRFEMAQAVATMPRLLHISVLLFFAGLVDFLFPIYATVAYATLGCILVFALAYVILTVLPNIFLNCPYATPLSSFTWRISQFFVIVFLKTILEIRKSLSKIWSWVDQRVPESHGHQKWRKTLEQQVKTRQQWFSQGIRKSVELSAYRADSTVVTSALEWTLSALDEDKEIEDFAARVPGFFDSRVVQDATLAVLPLMSHQSNADPVFGSRLYDLLKTCIPETSLLDEKPRNNRLRVCLKCLWYFGRAYNQLGSSRVLPSYIPETLASPQITRRVRAEEDSSVRVIGRCFEALVVNKLAADIDSRTAPVTRAELACLSTILDTEGHEMELLLSQPGAVVIANMISFKFGEVSTLVADTIPSDVLDVVQQTLGVLSQVLPGQESAELQSDQPNAMTDVPDGGFERVLLSRLRDLLKTCTAVDSPLTEEVRTCCLRACMKGFWYLNPETAGRIREQGDYSVRMNQHCVDALVVNELATGIHSRTVPVSDTLTHLSSILGIERHDVAHLLNHPGAIQIINLIFLVTDDIFDLPLGGTTSGVLDVLDVAQAVLQTSSTLSRAHPAQIDEEMRVVLTDILMDLSEGVSSLPHVIRSSESCMCLKNLWHFTRAYIERGTSVPLPPYFYVAFTHITRRIRKEGYFSAQVISRCVGALIVNKLATDINVRTPPVNGAELACLSSILDSEVYDVELCLTQPAALELFNMTPFVLGSFGYSKIGDVPLDSSDILQQTLGILSRAFPDQENAELQPDQAVALSNVSTGTLERIIVSRLHGLLKICIPDTSTLTEDVRASCLRMSLKTLWHSSKAYHQISDPLPSYFPLILASPEFSHHFQNERDPISRMTGCCFRALIICKLVDDFTSPILLGGHVENAELACISAILGTRHRELSPHQLRIINFRKVVSLMSDEIDILFTMEGTPEAMLDIAQDTLYILVSCLRDRFKFEDVHHVPMDQRGLLPSIYKEVQNTVRSDSNRLKVQTVETLDRLRQMLEKLLSAMGLSQDTATQDLDR